MADHSPEPWRLVREGRKVLVVSGKRMNKQRVAEICVSHEHPWEANARLVIHAPDMHTALLRLLAADTEAKRLDAEARATQVVALISGD